jgi:hypothetical protein
LVETLQETSKIQLLQLYERSIRRGLQESHWHNTTEIRVFAECRWLCRVLFIGHSTKSTLPSAALGRVLRSVKSLFTECRALSTAKHSAKTVLPSVKHSANMALGKGPLAPSTTDGRQSLPSVKYLALGKESRCRVSYVDTRQSIFLFFLF